MFALAAARSAVLPRRVPSAVASAARRFLSVKYTKDHEYVSLVGTAATIGISNHAQAQLGDVVYVGLPEVGATFKKGCVACATPSTCHPFAHRSRFAHCGDTP